MLVHHTRRARSLSALLLGLTLAACGSAPQTTTNATTAPSAQTNAPAAAASSAITMQAFGDVEEQAVYQAMIDAYTKANPTRKVNLIAIPSQGDHMSKLAASFTAGNPPDVFLVNYRRYAQFAKSGVLEPLGPYMTKAGLKEADFYSIALDAFRYNGTLECMPQNVSSPVVYYNEQLFKERGVEPPKADWTWNDFLVVARQLTFDNNNDGKVDVYGLGVEPELIRLAPFIWQAGTELTDNPAKPTKLNLADPQANEAIQFFIKLRASYGVVPTEAEIKAEDKETRFRNGKLGMMIDSRRVVPLLRTIKDFTWNVAPLPIGNNAASVLHSDAYCMPASIKDKDATWDFINFAISPEGQKITAKLGRTVPSLKAIAESPDFLDPTQPPANSKVFLDAIPSIRVLPIVTTWPAIESAFNQEFEVAFYANDELEAAGAGGEVEKVGEFRRIPVAVQDIIDKALNQAGATAEQEFTKANAP